MKGSLFLFHPCCSASGWHLPIWNPHRPRKGSGWKASHAQNPFVVLICWPKNLIMIVISFLPCKRGRRRILQQRRLQVLCHSMSHAVFSTHIYWFFGSQQQRRMAGAERLEILLNPLIFLILKYTFYSCWWDIHSFPLWIAMKGRV